MTDLTTEARIVPPSLSAGWQFEHLDPRARWGMRLRAFVVALFALGVLWILVVVLFGVALDMAWPAAVAGAGVPATLLVAPILAFFHASARWRRTRYALTPQGLRIQRGVWWRSDTVVPRSRVQHTDLHRGPLDRALGLAGLRVYTAGSELGRVALNGLAVERAEALRDALIRVDEDVA
ncbi:MAG: PH domain-containing protein [Chiayiivirga sp.]|jgi:membrane protein YdbS with pleckstrin-like domain|nr:PH domain-containing protein [Chiayiivirga sp.]